MRCFYYLSFLYTWPLFLVYHLFLLRKKKAALFFEADLKRRNESFWELMYYHKVYRNLYYKRFPHAKIFKLICPPDKTFAIDGVSMKLGKGVFLMHSFLTIIHAQEIGENFTIFHNCTIGANVGTKGLPIIGNHVTIFTGAVVVGGVKICDNSIIGANAVITKNVPANSTVVGNPAYIIKQNGKKCYIKL